MPFSGRAPCSPSPHFGFFALTNGLPEELISGREELWTGKFIDDLEVVKGAVTPNDIAVFAGYLKDPAHVEASFQWFRTLPQDMVNDAVYQKTKLTEPREPSSTKRPCTSESASAT